MSFELELIGCKRIITACSCHIAWYLYWSLDELFLPKFIFLLIIWEINKHLTNDSYQLHIPHNSLLSFLTYQKKKISTFFYNQSWTMLRSMLPLDSCSLKFIHFLFPAWLCLTLFGECQVLLMDYTWQKKKGVGNRYQESVFGEFCKFGQNLAPFGYCIVLVQRLMLHFFYAGILFIFIFIFTLIHGVKQQKL